MRVRGAELPVITELALASAERIDKNLYDQPAEALAQAALARSDVQDLILEMLSRRSEKKKGR